MSRNRGSGKKTNILLVIICILLVGALGAILVMNQKAEKEESQRLEEIAGDQQRGIENYEAVKEHAAELEAADAALDESSDDNADAKSDKKNDTESNTDKESKDTNFDADKDTDTTGNADEKTEDADIADKEEGTDSKDTAQKSEEVSGIVCWGDDLINGTESDTYSYMAVLQKLLTEKGYTDLTVINKTLQGGGTLSMMKMAGVGDDVLQGYITKHQQAANGGQLNVTETGIRDLTEEELTRNDLDCIPVIFMGYYGGWNHDPAELAEQQENILNTFPNKDKFIVVGTRPLDGTVTSDALDQVLSQKWGEHYISLASVTPQPSATYEAQQAMAEAILAKMEELGYLSQN